MEKCDTHGPTKTPEIPTFSTNNFAYLKKNLYTAAKVKYILKKDATPVFCKLSFALKQNDRIE